MKNWVRRMLRKFIFSGDGNNEFFYGKYQGGQNLSLFKKILVIFLDLSSLKDYLIYHRSPLILNTIGKSSKNTVNKLSDFEQTSLKTLQNDGIVFLESYFKDQVTSLASDNLKGQKEPRNKQYFVNEISQSEDFFHIINDRSIINVASAYYGVKAYYRHRPNINFVNPARDDLISTQRIGQAQAEYFEGDEWHVDSVYNLQYHILLTDVMPGTSRMLFAKGEPIGLAERFCKYASEEYVRKNYSKVDCCGPKGTVYLFDGSIHWHRFCPVKISARASCSVLFSRGQQVADSGGYSQPLDKAKIADGMESSCKFLI